MFFIFFFVLLCFDLISQFKRHNCSITLLWIQKNLTQRMKLLLMNRIIAMNEPQFKDLQLNSHESGQYDDNVPILIL